MPRRYKKIQVDDSLIADLNAGRLSINFNDAAEAGREYIQMRQTVPPMAEEELVPRESS